MSSKTDFAVKLVLVLFITLLSFSIGTFVGKQYSDNQHQLALLEPTGKGAHSEATREVASVHGEESTPAKSSAMSDEEIAKLAEEFVADETESPAKATPEVAEQKNSEVKEAKAETHKVEASPAAKELAVTEKTPIKKDRIPSSLPKNVAQYTVGKFTVQVAAYSDESEAQKMASELKKKGYSAFYIPAAIKGQTWYRVSVGQFATQKEAQSYRSELMDKAKVGSAIVQKITE